MFFQKSLTSSYMLVTTTSYSSTRLRWDRSGTEAKVAGPPLRLCQPNEGAEVYEPPERDVGQRRCQSGRQRALSQFLRNGAFLNETGGGVRLDAMV